MSKYVDYEDANPADERDSDPDPRIVAMHRVVDLEQQVEAKSREADRRMKEAAIVRQELDQARRELLDLLGVGDSVAEKRDMR